MWDCITRRSETKAGGDVIMWKLNMKMIDSGNGLIPLASDAPFAHRYLLFGNPLPPRWYPDATALPPRIPGRQSEPQPEPNPNPIRT